MPVRCRPAATKSRSVRAHDARAAAKLLSIIFALLIGACGSAAAQTVALSAPVITPGDLTNGLAAGSQFQPQVARGAGGYLAVWADDRTAINNISAVAPFTGAGQGRQQDIYAARRGRQCH